MLKQHQITFITTVPGGPIQIKIRGMQQSTRQIEHQHDQERLRNPGVEKRLPYHAAFGRHIELPQLWIDQRHEGGSRIYGERTVS